MKQTFKTRSSIWTFDDESMRFLRTPKDRSIDHPTVAYENVAIRFINAYNWNGRVWVQLSDTDDDYQVSGALLDGETFTTITEETAR